MLRQWSKHVIKNISADTSTNRMILCLALGLYWVIFVWGFWDRGPFALGLNAFLFWVFLIMLYLRELLERKSYQPKDLAWLVPLFGIALNFILYENPFIKMVSIPLYPLLIALFFIYGFLHDKHGRVWSWIFLENILKKFAAVFGQLSPAASRYLDLLLPKENKKLHMLKRIIIGIVLFLAVAMLFVIPLLSSADPEFSSRIGQIFSLINQVFSRTLIYKALVWLVLAVLMLASLLAWGRKFDFDESGKQDKDIDSIISGIVIGGILVLYGLFLWLQLKRLWIGSLPFDFKETESLVKSGFWQLLILSLLNIAVYYFTYRKTASVVQGMLAAFTGASLLLLLSAGERMRLYATYYGFSYEKFYASYAVVFCAIVFGWLITALFRKRPADMLKFLAFLFLWMFFFIAVMPVEQFIFRANLKLVGMQNTRIRLYEMTMLSPDVLCRVKSSKEQGLLAERAAKLDREAGNGDGQFDWDPWISKSERILGEKRWYENTISSLLNSCKS